ncbi:MAG: hypothetical protein ABJA80_04090 [bacterium]
MTPYNTSSTNTGRSLMDQQLDAFAAAPARARSSDPTTSRDAAASVQSVRASHRRVLAMFKLYGDMTDEQLAESIREAEKDAGLVKLMSPSGVRSRRSELAKPNMDRLDEISNEIVAANPDLSRVALRDEAVDFNARRQLRLEGFRAPLWDTGKRTTLSTGRKAIVWGIAR